MARSDPPLTYRRRDRAEAADNGLLFGHRLDGQWLHVGTPQAITEAEETIKRSVYRSPRFAFTFWKDDKARFIRPVLARDMHGKEVRAYERYQRS